MKAIFLISVFCVLGGSWGAPTDSQLRQDLQDFINLLPQAELQKIAEDYYKNDKQVQETLKYLTGKEFAEIWAQVIGNKEFQKLVTYLDNAGLHATEFLNNIAKIFNLPKFPPQTLSGSYRTGGLNGMMKDIMSKLPRDKLKALFREKLQTSQAFKALYDRLSSAEFQKILHFVKSSPEMTNALNLLRQNGVDVTKIVEYIKALFGWH